MGHGQPTDVRRKKRETESARRDGSEPMPGTAAILPVPSARRPQDAPTGWHSRHYLPHYDQPGLIQMITFRLADSFPQSALDQMDGETKGPPDAEVERRRRLQILLDAGHGTCHLRRPEIARLLEEAFLYFDGVRYRLLAWSVMPNHVHVLIETITRHSLSEIVHSWKSFTANQANRLLGRSGAFWHPDYFDRAIRDGHHFRVAVEYIENNPVKARLVLRAELWPYGSARRRSSEPGTGKMPAVPGIRRHAYPP
jgi:REP element-mobilizing transposase RayT